MRVRIKFLSLFIFLFSFSFCHGQNWLWARQSNCGVESYSMAIDNKNNAYLTGLIGGTLIWGNDTVHQINPENTFLIKSDANGNYMWGRESSVFLGSSAYAWSITTHGDYIYITGEFTDSVLFGAYKLVAKHSRCGFLVKYDNNGNVVWAKQSSINTYPFSITTDKNGNIFSTGQFGDTVIFGLDTLETSNPCMYIAKYDSNGNVKWAKQAKPNVRGSIQGNSITTDDYGYIYSTGYFADTTSFQTATFYSTRGGIFVIKCDTSGNLVWANQSTDNNNYISINTNSIVVDKLNNAYIAGTGCSLKFDSVNLSKGCLDIYVIKFNSLGKAEWGLCGNEITNTSWYGYSLAIDTVGHLYVSGAPDNHSLINTIAFGKDTFSINNDTSKDASIILEFDTSGKTLCGTMTLGGGEDDGNSIVCDGSGNYVYFGGDLDATTIFGIDTLVGNETPLIARWRACTSSAGIENIFNNNSNTKLFPNPNNGSFKLLVNSTEINWASSTIEIYNILGEKIYEKPIHLSQSVYNISIGSRPYGVYFYRVITDDGILLGEDKFVIVK